MPEPPVLPQREATSPEDSERRSQVYDLEGVLGPTVTQFVDSHVSTLLAWDLLVFFHHNPDERLALEDLSGRLGRHAEEIDPEIDALCAGGILACVDGVIYYSPKDDMGDRVDEFVSACEDRGKRLALIALVLHRMSKAPSRDR